MGITEVGSQSAEPEHKGDHEFLPRRQEHAKDDGQWETQDNNIQRDAGAYLRQAQRTYVIPHPTPVP